MGVFRNFAALIDLSEDLGLNIGETH